MASGHDPYAALRYPDYRRVLLGSVVASVGIQMQTAALDWELYQRTGDPRAVGWVGLVQFLPVLLLSLPAGQAVDRFNRKAVLMAAQATIALAAVGLAVLSFTEGPLWLVYACLLLTGIGRAFSAPARWALVPMVVPMPLLSNAVTWNSSGWQLASVAGPALSGLVIAYNVSFAYVITGGAALACAALIATTRPRPQERSNTERSLHSLLAGARFVWRTKPILATITMDLFAVLFGGATALLAIFASQEYLDAGPVGYGWLRAAPALGAFVMALLLAHLPPLPRPGVTLLWAVAAFGAATIVFGLSRDFTLSFIMLALTGAFDNISVVVRGTLVQVLTPDAMRGRVSAVNSVFIGSSNELGAYESGETAAWFGPVASVVGGGIATILVVISSALLWPQLLRLGPLHKVDRRDAATGEDVGSAGGTSGWGGPDGARAILGKDESEPVRDPGA